MLTSNVKATLAALSTDERRQAIAYLITLDADRDAHREQIARKIDDKDPAHWIPVEQLNHRLGLEEPQK